MTVVLSYVNTLTDVLDRTQSTLQSKNIRFEGKIYVTRVHGPFQQGQKYTDMYPENIISCLSALKFIQEVEILF